MEHLREQVMINQFVQVIKYIFITVHNSWGRQRKLWILSVLQEVFIDGGFWM